MTPRILIVAGSDSGGGAGIQADIKTVTMLGGHAMTAITAITAQNTLGVDAVMPVPTDMVLAQIDAVVRDLGVDAVKIGMIGSAETAHKVATWLADYCAGQTDVAGLSRVRVVVDPVMVATSGAALADEATVAALRELMAVASVITPNVPELGVLTGMPVGSGAEVERAGIDLAQAQQTYVLAKGGHLPGETIVDRLFDMDGRQRVTTGLRIPTRHTHGTGCTLASAIATLLGRGHHVAAAVDQAQAFVRAALLAAPGFGGGHGPMGHWAAASGLANLNQVTLPVADYDQAARFYRSLGLTQIVDSPGNRYARFEFPGGATLSIQAGEAIRPGDAEICIESADLDAWVARLQAAGVAFDSLPEDKRWGWREAHLRDPAGNRLILYWAGENRRFPPWRLSTAE